MLAKLLTWATSSPSVDVEMVEEVHAQLDEARRELETLRDQLAVAAAPPHPGTQPVPASDDSMRAALAEQSSGPAAETALLHEAWMKLERSQTRFESRAHFIAVAAKAMRQILVNRARDRDTAKRGGGARRTTLTGLGESQDTVDLLALDRALDALEEVDPDAARVVLMRAFGGLTLAEVAEVLEVSERSVSRSWRFARAFLKDALGGA